MKSGWITGWKSEASISVASANLERSWPLSYDIIGVDYLREVWNKLSWSTDSNNMMIGSKGPSDALARSLETLIAPQNTNGVVILHGKMTRAVSVLAAHCTRSVRAANHQLGAKYLLTPAS